MLRRNLGFLYVRMLCFLKLDLYLTLSEIALFKFSGVLTPIVGTAPCDCPSRIIGISHGTAQGLSPTDPQNNPQFLPRINAIVPDAEYNKRRQGNRSRFEGEWDDERKDKRKIEDKRSQIEYKIHEETTPSRYRNSVCNGCSDGGGLRPQTHPLS